MTTVAIIPARAGSKGIPGKNKQMLCGKPLISWTIAAAQAAHSLDHIMVSTDDEEIADIALALGVNVPFLRPPELAQDNTSSIEPVLHALSIVDSFDSAVLLQPTSPLRTATDIDAIIDLAIAKAAKSAVSVCESREPIQWNFTIQLGGSLKPLLAGEMINRRQEAGVTYVLNGALYYFDVRWFLTTKKFIDIETLPYIMPQERSIDIDSDFDWMMAEFLLDRRGR